jgi:hypothetical protein
MPLSLHRMGGEKAGRNRDLQAGPRNSPPERIEDSGGGFYKHFSRPFLLPCRNYTEFCGSSLGQLTGIARFLDILRKIINSNFMAGSPFGKDRRVFTFRRGVQFAGSYRVSCIYRFANLREKFHEMLLVPQTMWWKTGKSGTVGAWKVQQAGFMRTL